MLSWDCLEGMIGLLILVLDHLDMSWNWPELFEVWVAFIQLFMHLTTPFQWSRFVPLPPTLKPCASTVHSVCSHATKPFELFQQMEWKYHIPCVYEQHMPTVATSAAARCDVKITAEIVSQLRSILKCPFPCCCEAFSTVSVCIIAVWHYIAVSPIKFTLPSFYPWCHTANFLYCKGQNLGGGRPRNERLLLSTDLNTEACSITTCL